MSGRVVTRRQFVKGISLAGAGVLAPSLLAACGGGGDDRASTAGAVTLAFQMGQFTADDVTNHQWIIDRFQQANQGVTVKFSNYDWAQMDAQINAAFASPSPPDLIYLIDTVFPRFATTDQLLDLTPHVNAPGYASEKANLVGWDIATWESKILGFPAFTVCNFMYYNKDLFAQAGISAFPTTYQELRAAAQALTNPSKKQFGFAMRSNVNEAAMWDWFPYIYNAGAALLSPDLTRAGFDTPEVVDAMQLLQDLNTNLKVSPEVGAYDWEGLQALFEAGRIGILMSGQTTIGRLLEKPPKFQWDIAKVPAGPKANVVTGDFGFHMVPAKSKHPDEAVKFAEFWMSRPMVTEFGRRSGALPLRKDLDPKQLFPDNPYMQRVTTEFVPDIVGLQPHPKWREAMTAAWPFVVESYQGRRSPAEAVKEAAGAVNKVMGVA